MICKIVEKIALFVFWKCLDEKTRDANIKAHRYSKIDAAVVEEKVEFIQKAKDEIEVIKDEIKSINLKILKGELNFEDVKTKLQNMEASFE